ncbi:ribosomal large subunit pseudouridine synthase B [Pelagirhabdus alkalitolerans]|uniref:Pseudouridine synthase n=1 Tax=Pelagirhabdus alkalitolerans TaxID=1612202 RepID=A0A1G6HBU3_9BACI|nr:pseudouridine synthase [Pelagirhabdus alkalitolerans]SDB91624.1 ribosomal large subunit pseudouridine synthase B [Pelagirhabdus alkalitolerans]
MSNNLERLQKVIAQSGLTSRRKAEGLIEEGRVEVNNQKVTELGTKVTENDEIKVDGVPLTKDPLVHYLVYKPRGVISSVKDDKNRKVVTELIPEIDERVYPVGRLDYDTSGLVLLTNDGDLTQLLMHPSHEIDKVYVAKVKGIPTNKDLKPLIKGVFSEGEKLKAVSAKVLSNDSEKKNSIVEITLHEGKNRQVRRMLEAINYPVQKLKRERYSFLDLKGMQPGEYRELTPHEVKQLRADALKEK